MSILVNVIFHLVACLGLIVGGALLYRRHIGAMTKLESDINTVGQDIGVKK